MVSEPRRVGIFGGTFDPVHVGHLVAAVNARHSLRLDVVLLVVANIPWQKAGERPVSSAADRLAMVEAAVGDVEGLEVSRAEVDRGGPSYTADTLAAVRRQYPDAELSVIVGADVADRLHTWERVEEVRRDATLVVVNRPGWTPPAALAGWRVETVEIPELAISSTDLRQRACDGRPLDYLVPAAAVSVIRARRLYADT
ncbi:MAG TPA: nicotinate-nucleotide adenylyltransferase [Acidimicrobiales bacterium]|nr:nicotinate-nucleotide adenylyltransferase [Acidimicrobiales bacterium]